MPSSLVVASLSNMSPSLRGSGLKLHRFGRFFYNLMSPSLRGSGLKSKKSGFRRRGSGLPLYEGVD